ncbi:protein GRAVITROPIC IN THE LIGHT 1-like [Salvia miltiorrhiza]|uniref:protein GRAVITROPIC IN THE LIGHT 1-like n=1 Tax=Salvia miltiorrhiza TaxID=226208 RepID=UPI0025ACD203|nr:protein GRAVITROPIC IN THE LIGHT 1-like [Salvia miltiorrhiza]
MDSVTHSAVTPKKSRLARTFAKVLHARAAAGVDEDIRKAKSREKMKKDRFKIDEEMRDKAVREAFVAKLFAGLSSIKASYAQLQYAQSPYDADGIQSADQVIVAELKKLSELKQCYLKKELHESSPAKALLVAEAQEQSSLVKTYEITSKKLDSQVKLKESEIMFLKEKLVEINGDCKLLDKRLNSSGVQLAFPDGAELSRLRPSHFVALLRQVVKSVRSFVRLLVDEMESEDWDLDAAAASIQPGVSFWERTHICFAFESFVSREIFDGFDRPYFSHENVSSSPEKENLRRVFFDRFTELKSLRPADYLARKPKSKFAAFCRAKYLRVVHRKMEESFFGNLNQRNLVSSGKLPETTFFGAFVEMAKRVWLLHCLALALDPEAAIFRVSGGSRFSEVYMEGVSDEAFDASPEPVVAFTVVPGFRVGSMVVQSQVYLS